MTKGEKGAGRLTHPQMVLTHTWTAVVGGSNVCAVFEEEEIDFG